MKCQLLIGVAALSLSAGAAEAARPAVAVEESAILKASGFPPGSAGIKSGCVRPVVRVSGNSAFVFFTFRNSSACIRYAFNGSICLRLVGGKWKQVFVGSDVPSCDLGLPADLTPCRPITALAGVTAYGYERAVLSGDIGTACSLLSAEGVAALRRAQPRTAGRHRQAARTSCADPRDDRSRRRRRAEWGIAGEAEPSRAVRPLVRRHTARLVSETLPARVAILPSVLTRAKACDGKPPYDVRRWPKLIVLKV